MSGVRTGTRLEQLHALRDRLDLEIRAEEAHQLGGRLTGPATGGRWETYQRPARRTRPPDNALSRTDDLLEALGVTSLDVKRWAVEKGRLDHVPRGRVAYELVVAYYQEHTP